MRLGRQLYERLAFLKLLNKYWEAHPLMTFTELVDSLTFIPGAEDEVLMEALSKWKDAVEGAKRCEEIGGEPV